MEITLSWLHLVCAITVHEERILTNGKLFRLAKKQAREQSREVHIHNASTQEVDTGRLGIQGYPWLCNKLEASLGYMKASLQN